MRIRRACLALVLVCLLAMALPAPMHAYDANGNMTARGTQTIEWDAGNRPVSVKVGGSAIASFVYDGLGDRVMKTAGGQTTVYVNDYYEKVLGGAETLHYYLGGLYIGYKKGGTLKYVHTDHLGSTSLVTNTSGATVSEIRYYPFGKTRSVTPAGSLDTDIRFTGQRYDSETGLYYYRARYYDPDLGRFLSPDSIVQDPANPQAWNPYSYVLNNPLKYTDPSGHFIPLLALLGYALLAADIGFTAYDAYTYYQDPSTENAVWLGVDLFGGAVLGKALKVGSRALRYGDEAIEGLRAFHAGEAGRLGRGAGDVESALAHVSPSERADAMRALKNFNNGSAAVETLDEDMVVFRRWGGTSEELGSPWYSTKYYSSAKRARRYLALPDVNTAENVTAYTIPRGTTILRGRAVSKVGVEEFGPYAVGGGEQIFVVNGTGIPLW